MPGSGAVGGGSDRSDQKSCLIQKSVIQRPGTGGVASARPEMRVQRIEDPDRESNYRKNLENEEDSEPIPSAA